MYGIVSIVFVIAISRSTCLLARFPVVVYIRLRLFPDSRVSLDFRYVRLIASLPILVLSYVRDRVYPYSRTTVCNSRTSRVRDRVSPDTGFPVRPTLSRLPIPYCESSTCSLPFLE